mgnify:CR=1 FL=1
MTFEKVAQVIAENRDMDVSEITMDTTFEDLQLDSLDTVDLVMSLEEIFDITIEMQEGLKSVGDVVNLIDSLLEKK